MKRASSASRMVLAGDVGGTKTNLALYTAGGQRPRNLLTKTFRSLDFPNIEGIIQTFLAGCDARPSAACLGLPGPVSGGRCRTTNLPWEVSEAALTRRIGLKRVILLNDVQATAAAIPILRPSELASLNDVRAAKGGNCALIAPGTGLGIAFLASDGRTALPMASEGGHVDWAPNNDEEAKLWSYLARCFGHVSAERVLSGPGQVNIYDWLRDSNNTHPTAWLAARMTETDPARAITEAALERRDPLAARAVSMFVAIFGAVAGNMALAAAATGGVFLGGGIPPKILQFLKEGTFMTAFEAKGRFAPYMRKLPVRVILNDKAAILGCAHHALAGAGV